jgi:aldose 1-epimerase
MGITINEKTIGGIKTKEVTYESGIQRLTITSLGASIKRYETIDKDGHFASIIMHYDDDALYLDNPKFLGTTVGPYAGRIFPPKLSLNNKVYPLESNFLNHSNLHSGSSNIAFKNFDVVLLNDHQVEFTYTSSEADAFPGPITYTFMYTFKEDKLRMDYYTRAKEDAVISITNHSYFNLSGDLKTSILNHQLTIPSEKVVALDDYYIGTKVIPVADTPFDFRRPKPLKDGINPLKNTPTKGIDHPFYINNNQPIVLHDPVSKRTLKVSTSYPALVVYTNNLPTDVRLNNNQPDVDHYAVCLEAQHVPNDIYFETHPKSIVNAETLVHNYIEYQIRIDS